MSKVIEMKTNEEKTKYILANLQSGKSREEIATELGYKNYKTMDSFIRRGGYSWDRNVHNYVLTSNLKSGRYAANTSALKTNAAEKIVALFAKGEVDAKDIAKESGFKSYIEMGQYLKSKGYIWDGKKKEYYLSCQKEETIKVLPSLMGEDDTKGQAEGISPSKGEVATKYSELLEYLSVNENILRKIIQEYDKESATGALPRHAIPGILVTKSVHMTNSLAQMVKDYSQEKNITQRAIFEVALIDFFRKYGYEREIDTMINIK